MNVDHSEEDTKIGLGTAIRAYLLKGPEIEFLVDLLKNSVVFIGILSIAAGLNSAVDWVENRHYPWYIVDGLLLVEILLFLADIIWFSCKIVVTAWSETAGIFKRYGISLKMPRLSGVRKS